LHDVGEQVPVVEPAAQVFDPVPLAIVQLAAPAGLEQLWLVVGVPHWVAPVGEPEAVGVQDWEVEGCVPQLAVPVGVQLCEVDGFVTVAEQKESATVAPRLSRQATVRLWDPEFVFQPQVLVRV
jgi:hypothetical protein